MLYLDKGPRVLRLRKRLRRSPLRDARRRPLDQYYRCNIVNNVPLSWHTRARARNRARVYVRTRVTALRRLARQWLVLAKRVLPAPPFIPLQALPVFTVEYSFFGRALVGGLPLAESREHGERSAHYPILQSGSGLTIRLP